MVADTLCGSEFSSLAFVHMRPAPARAGWGEGGEECPAWQKKRVNDADGPQAAYVSMSY